MPLSATAAVNPIYDFSVKRGRTRVVDVPQEIRAVDTLADPDYVYGCEIPRLPTDTRTAEQWARAVFEGAPRLVRWFIVAGWIGGLGLRLGPRPSPSHVLGWKVLSTTPTVAVLGVESFMLSAHLVVRVHESHVLHATFVRYDRPPARIVWAVAAPVHRRVIPFLLRHAAG
jgi:hypothetical protein